MFLFHAAADAELEAIQQKLKKIKNLTESYEVDVLAQASDAILDEYAELHKNENKYVILPLISMLAHQLGGITKVQSATGISPFAPNNELPYSVSWQFSWQQKIKLLTYFKAHPLFAPHDRVYPLYADQLAALESTVSHNTSRMSLSAVLIKLARPERELINNILKTLYREDELSASKLARITRIPSSSLYNCETFRSRAPLTVKYKKLLHAYLLSGQSSPKWQSLPERNLLVQQLNQCKDQDLNKIAAELFENISVDADIRQLAHDFNGDAAIERVDALLATVKKITSDDQVSVGYEAEHLFHDEREHVLYPLMMRLVKKFGSINQVAAQLDMHRNYIDHLATPSRTCTFGVRQKLKLYQFLSKHSLCLPGDFDYKLCESQMKVLAVTASDLSPATIPLSRRG